MELLSTPKAQIQGGPFGIVNLQKLQLLEKYFGKKLTVAKVDCLFNLSSSKLNICTVPWSDVTHRFVLELLKLIQYMVACKTLVFNKFDNNTPNKSSM